jgi:hypothetical protein
VLKKNREYIFKHREHIFSQNLWRIIEEQIANNLRDPSGDFSFTAALNQLMAISVRICSLSLSLSLSLSHTHTHTRECWWITPSLGVVDEIEFFFKFPFFFTGVARNAGGWQASGFGGFVKYPSH